MKRLFLYFIFYSLVSCSNAKYKANPEGDRDVDRVYEAEEEASEDEDGYSDGTWCAEVEYYNPNTGTRNTYDLDVEVEGGELVQINWPNGGWLDESHFVAEDISEGECSFISDKGYHYSVTLSSKGGCGGSDGYRLQNDMEEERRMTTCPRCGDEKDSYNKLCDVCEDEEETCPKCNGYKMEWDKICDSCEDEINEKEDY